MSWFWDSGKSPGEQSSSPALGPTLPGLSRPRQGLASVTGQWLWVDRLGLDLAHLPEQHACPWWQYPWAGPSVLPLVLHSQRPLCCSRAHGGDFVCVRWGSRCEHMVIVTHPGAPQQATGAGVA